MTPIDRSYRAQFRLKRKRSKYYVLFRGDEAHPKCTGVPAAVPLEAAVGVARAMLLAKATARHVSLQEFAKDFFTDVCPWTRRMTHGRRNRHFNPLYISQKRGYLVNYVLPRWGYVPLELVDGQSIDDWLETLQGKMTRRPLSGSALDDILQVLRIILDQAVAQGYLQVNVARQVKPFDTPGVLRRERFSPEEMRQLFPSSLDDAVRVWATLHWYVFFLMTYTCGLRPQETSGFQLADWIPELHGAVFRRRVVSVTRTVEEGIKTVKKGMAVKAVLFCERLERALQVLREKGAKPDELLFIANDGRPIHCQVANKHFRASAKRAGVELGKRTQYCLRHTYYTELLKTIPENDVLQLAGHTTLRKEYDHRKGLDFLRGRQGLLQAVNSLTA